MAVLMAFLLIAAAFDLKTFHIPNALILTGAALGVCFAWGQAVSTNTDPPTVFLLPAAALAFRLAQVFASLFLLMPLWKLHVLGGGDIKSVAVSVLFLGLTGALHALLYAGIFAILLSGAKKAAHRLRPDLISDLTKKENYHICHFSPAFFLGVLCLIFLGNLFPIS